MKHQIEACRVLFSTIQAAIKGDTEAINKVLNYYEGYISKLSTKRYYDKSERKYECVDEDIRRQLQIKLIMQISHFKLE